MQAIPYALGVIKFEIGLPVLKFAFLSQIGPNSYANRNLDWEIRKKVIDGRVRIDCDTQGFQEERLSVCESQYWIEEGYGCIIKFSPEQLGGREIISVNSYEYFTRNSEPGNTFGANTSYVVQGGVSGPSSTMRIGRRILDAAKPQVVNATSSVEIIEHNTILIRDWFNHHFLGSVTVQLSSDPEFRSLDTKSYPDFGQLCIYATQAYIYTTTQDVLNDYGPLYGGFEMESIKNQIDGFSDAHELYKTFRKEQWNGIQYMASPNRYHTHVKALIPGIV